MTDQPPVPLHRRPGRRPLERAAVDPDLPDPPPRSCAAGKAREVEHLVEDDER